MGPPPEKFTENENYYRNQNITTEPYQKSPRNGFLQKKGKMGTGPEMVFVTPDKMGTVPKMDFVTPDKMGPVHETKNIQKMKITIESGTLRPN